MCGTDCGVTFLFSLPCLWRSGCFAIFRGSFKPSVDLSGPEGFSYLIHSRLLMCDCLADHQISFPSHRSNAPLPSFCRVRKIQCPTVHENEPGNNRRRFISAPLLDSQGAIFVTPYALFLCRYAHQSTNDVTGDFPIKCFTASQR